MAGHRPSNRSDGATSCARRRCYRLPAVSTIGPQAWAARALTGDTSRKRMVVVFMRGAVDGLNVVVLYGDSQYYEQRPDDCDSTFRRRPRGARFRWAFGLNPALAPVMPMWRDGTLAFVHACGSPDPTRLHFDAQDYMESGTPGRKKHGRRLDESRHRCTSRCTRTDRGGEPGPTVPRILSGPMAVANIPLGRAAARPLAMDNPKIEDAFDCLYTGDDPISRAYQEGRVARKRLLTELQQDMTEANNGAPSPNGFSDDTGRLARLIARDPSIRLAFLAIGGWDTSPTRGRRKASSRII